MGPGELGLRGMLQGVNIPRERVKAEICPGCRFKRDICGMIVSGFFQKLSGNPDLRVSCPGLRAWAIRRN